MANSARDVVTAGTGINPYRLSHFQDAAMWVPPFSEQEAANYLEVQRASIQDPSVALDFRIPGYFSYAEVLEIELSRALAGELPPQEALDSIVREWNKLTDELGRDTQLAAYRAAMGLPQVEN
jgi:multiple sugar transport system substrate-binding protein